MDARKMGPRQIITLQQVMFILAHGHQIITATIYTSGPIYGAHELAKERPLMKQQQRNSYDYKEGGREWTPDHHRQHLPPSPLAHPSTELMSWPWEEEGGRDNGAKIIS